MVKDTKRDRVWKAAIELDKNPPEYSVYSAGTTGSKSVVGFTKADIQKSLDPTVGKRTIHDVIMTMYDYDLIDMVKEPSHASIGEHPITGDRAQADIYRLK
jgi:hypothetical protein